MSETVKCADEECTRTYAAHRWGKIKAGSDGWFFPKEGAATCPEHNPPWVAEWREAQH